MIISTGMSTLEEVKDAISTCYKAGNQDLVILQCTANYPADIKNSNVKVIKFYRDNLKVIPGYSDHTIGKISSICAVAIGAKVVEKHFTLDKNLPGPDHQASMEPAELKDFIQSIRESEVAVGNGRKTITGEEKQNKLRLQKSVVTINKLTKGQIISKDNIAIKRPADGIPPKYFYKLFGIKVKKNVPADFPLKFSDLSKLPQR